MAMMKRLLAVLTPCDFSLGCASVLLFSSGELGCDIQNVFVLKQLLLASVLFISPS
jgi:hypothetical protein